MSNESVIKHGPSEPEMAGTEKKGSVLLVERKLSLAARRLHESNLLESSSNAFKVTGSIAYHRLSCYLATLDLNTLSNLNIPYLFLELIGNEREFMFPRKTPKKISGKVPYRFVTTGSEENKSFVVTSFLKNKTRTVLLSSIQCYLRDRFGILHEVVERRNGIEKSDEDMELPQATERVIPLESERAKMLNMGPDDVAQPVTVLEEKCLLRALLISADECVKKKRTDQSM
ncbi:hypothetical protein TNCV_4046531 [Trichonephila clavipes]|nr:hypothetical protein TNCV_4046531 [Trichonephila clavipes]